MRSFVKLCTMTDLLPCYNFAEVWTQAKSVSSPINRKLTWRRARGFKCRNNIKRLCGGALPSRDSEADWCKDQWHSQKRLAHVERNIASCWLEKFKSIFSFKPQQFFAPQEFAQNPHILWKTQDLANLFHPIFQCSMPWDFTFWNIFVDFWPMQWLII